MDADANLLSEILVTGYQNIKRENATGAYQVISAKELDERYTTDLVSRLEGQIPGLTITEKQTYDNRRWASASELLAIEKANFDLCSADNELYMRISSMTVATSISMHCR